MKQVGAAPSRASRVNNLSPGGWRVAGFALAMTACVLIAAYALWYTSSGRYPVFPFIQNDYTDLGDAFLRGRVDLLEQPDPRLALLADPYAYRQRGQIPYHWDASYYRGRYYLYWGPVPALVSAGIEAMFGSAPPSAVLVVLPYILLLGIFIALMLFIAWLSPSRMRHASLWLFETMAFFNLPMLFIIGQARHYQASIMYGQLFLLAGLLTFALYTSTQRAGLLLLSGLAWGLAVASRYNLAVSVGIYVLFALLWIGARGDRRRFWLTSSALIAPLTLCVLGLGVYNFVRFGDPRETGMVYQLTIPEFRQTPYSTAYIPVNLYVYLLYPLTGSSSFPFIQSAHFRPSLVPDWIEVPPHRQIDQAIFGVLRTVPAVWLLALALPFLILIGRDLRQRGAGTIVGDRRNLLLAMVATAAAGQFLFLMVFFYAAERYIADFYLPLILCLAIILWRVDETLAPRSVLRVGLWLLVLALTLWTAGIGYFSCFGVPTLVTGFYDPKMLARLADFWNGAYGFIRAISGAG